MNNTPNAVQLSIIVPVYNTEMYIKRCMESLLNQSVKDYEIIIIDDGSTDNSNKIISSYCTKNDNIHAITLPENAGVGNARNAGLAVAHGKYIAFVDSDDWVDTNMYNELLTLVKRTGSPIATCGIKDEYDNFISSKIRYGYKYENVLKGSYALSLLSRLQNQDIFITPMVCNKIYESDFIRSNSLKFEKNSYYEDDIFTFTALMIADNIAVLPGTYYHYYQRQSSITHTFSKKHIDDFIDAFIRLKQIICQGDFSAYEKEYQAYIEKCMTSMLAILFSTERNISNQKKYIAYLLSKSTQILSTTEFIEYIDIQRIRKFFNL